LLNVIQRDTKKARTSKPNRFEHEVAISYAGEDGKIANKIAQSLRDKGIPVFYDKFSQTELWGKQLSSWFKKTYGKSSRFVLVLVSHHYSVKDWADFEFSVARAEEKRRKREFILPVRIDDTKLSGLPSDKVYLDLRKVGLDEVVECLVQKVKAATSNKMPEQVFRKAYEEWKIDDYLPGESKAKFFLDNLSDLKLDVNGCEFLLRSLTGYYPNLREKLGTIDRKILFEGALRLLAKGETHYVRWKAIRYLVFADAKKAEPHLWNLYADAREDFNLRAEAFQRLWMCESERGLQESYSVILNEPQWQLRQAAAGNIGHGKVHKDTSQVLAKALRDRRGEVRAQAAYAIVQLKLKDLVPDMVDAIKRERSRKAANRLLYCIWIFKDHPSVRELPKEHTLPSWFEKTPDYHAAWEDLIYEML